MNFSLAFLAFFLSGLYATLIWTSQPNAGNRDGNFKEVVQALNKKLHNLLNNQPRNNNSKGAEITLKFKPNQPTPPVQRTIVVNALPPKKPKIQSGRRQLAQLSIPVSLVTSPQAVATNSPVPHVPSTPRPQILTITESSAGTSAAPVSDLFTTSNVQVNQSLPNLMTNPPSGLQGSAAEELRRLYSLLNVILNVPRPSAVQPPTPPLAPMSNPTQAPSTNRDLERFENVASSL